LKRKENIRRGVGGHCRRVAVVKKGVLYNSEFVKKKKT